MTISKHEEYKLPNGQTVSIQFNGYHWEVGCWNTDDTAHWYKEFEIENEARKEYERWK
jgi:hypothetical protein